MTDFNTETTEIETNSLPDILTPCAGLNSILAKDGGFRRGELVVISSLSTGQLGRRLLTDLHVGCGLVNKPHLIDDTRKPLVVHITCVPDVKTHFNFVTERISAITGLENNSYLNDRLLKSGFKYRTIYIKDIEHYTVADLLKTLEELEEEGFELHQVTIDGFEKMREVTELSEPMYIRNLLRDIRGFFNSRKTLAILTLPIDDNAVDIIRCTGRDFIKGVSALGLYGRYNRIHQDVDCELIITAELSNDDLMNVYPVVYCGKHRGRMRDVDVVKYAPESATPVDIHLGDGFDDPEFIEAFQTTLSNLPGHTTTSLDSTLGATNDLEVLEGVMIKPYFEPNDNK